MITEWSKSIHTCSVIFLGIFAFQADMRHAELERFSVFIAKYNQHALLHECATGSRRPGRDESIHNLIIAEIISSFT
jgi:hypothetical protein